MQDLRREVSKSDLPEKVKNLRTHALKNERENWDALVFCYLLGEASGLAICMSREEESDFDSVFTWQEDGTQCFAPVQMKELVSEELNPNATLEAIFEGLKKYVDSDDLVVAIKLNRVMRIDPAELVLPELPVGEIFLFGSSAPDDSEWFLIGFNKGMHRTWKIPMAFEGEEP